ncbi:MAG: hypothetical protein DMG69_27770 [Acidobacteria bacterium]|nr:MAG: hypothetical protein DMG69_27770 [Acidobacteriota bacterium]
MLSAVRSVFFGGVVLFLASLPLFSAGTLQVGRNSDPTYQQLRNLTLGEAVTVNNLDLRRDAATFHLRSGTVCFASPVQDKVTGAVFVGDGNFVIAAPSASERSMLKLLTKEDEFSENFSQMVLRFTDATYDELKKAGSAAAGGCDSGPLKDSQNATRHNRQIKYNLEARILEDVLSLQPGALFVAFVHGKRYSDKELFTIDPHSALEDVALETYEESKSGLWAGFPLSERSKNAVHRNRFYIEHQQLDATIEKSGNLIGKASTTLVSQNDGLRIVPLELFRTLRVDSVTGDGGVPLSFIQEDKNDDADFSVILPKALAAGEKYTVTTTYSGKEAVSNEGGGNYFPIARSSWYPNNPTGGLGQYTTYDMTFRIPKGMKIAATGDLVSESNDGGQNVTVWKSRPQTVAGFSFGRFKIEEAKLTKPEYLVQSFANQEPPDWVQSLQQSVSGDNVPVLGASRISGVALGTMGTTSLNKKALAEGQIAVQLYTDYFGPSSYKRLALTQQTACNFGQSWPQLVWIPICYFFDTTVRHQLGIEWGNRGYWKVVTPHEVAHQWWGHSVGFGSYRDQWMSEGFSDFSAALYLQTVYSKEPNRYLEFWKDERELLTERNKEGYRAIDAGPLTLGYRLSNTRTGYDITRRLIYPKGAYVLHMVRMMMWDRKNGDQLFRDTMQDFVKTYSNKPATTEDFKAMIEKHMTPEMDLQGNHRMDWFFNEYVYGTALPGYKLDYSFDKDPSGDVLFSLKVTQSGVDDNFRMLVPVYLELADGRTVNFGRARLSGNTSVEQKVAIRGLKTAPKRALLNYNYDVLASN